jgi:hypothetical protein
MPKRILLLALIVSSLLPSCSKTVYSGLGTDNLVIYPSPPDTARIQFLAKISGARDLAGERNSFSRFIFGDGDNTQINKPYGIAMHKGKILVVDTFIRGIVIIDMVQNKFDQFIPKGRGELKVPVNCFVDASGYLYITDTGRKQIVVFDENGKYSDSFGESENFKPSDVFVTDNRIWVANLEGHQICEYSADSTHRLLKKFPDAGTGEPGSLFSPTNIYVTDNQVYVSDFGDFKIKIYTREGEFIRSVGSYGQAVGQFARPKGIAVDRDANLYVVDAGFENTQVFNKEGKLLMFFGGSYNGPGDMWLPAKITIDYDNLEYFQKFVDPGFNLKYLILVTNQFGPDKIGVYGAIEPGKEGKKSTKRPQKKNLKKQGPMF